MAFTWSENIAVGGAIKAAHMTEIQSAVDWIDDNRICSSDNTGVCGGDNASFESGFVVGNYGTEKEGRLSGEHGAVYPTEYSGLETGENSGVLNDYNDQRYYHEFSPHW